MMEYLGYLVGNLYFVLFSLIVLTGLRGLIARCWCAKLALWVARWSDRFAAGSMVCRVGLLISMLDIEMLARCGPWML